MSVDSNSDGELRDAGVRRKSKHGHTKFSRWGTQPADGAPNHHKASASEPHSHGRTGGHHHSRRSTQADEASASPQDEDPDVVVASAGGGDDEEEGTFQEKPRHEWGALKKPGSEEDKGRREWGGRLHIVKRKLGRLNRFHKKDAHRLASQLGDGPLALLDRVLEVVPEASDRPLWEMMLVVHATQEFKSVGTVLTTPLGELEHYARGPAGERLCKYFPGLRLYDLPPFRWIDLGAIEQSSSQAKHAHAGEPGSIPPVGFAAHPPHAAEDTMGSPTLANPRADFWATQLEALALWHLAGVGREELPGNLRRLKLEELTPKDMLEMGAWAQERGFSRQKLSVGQQAGGSLEDTVRNYVRLAEQKSRETEKVRERYDALRLRFSRLETKGKAAAMHEAEWKHRAKVEKEHVEEAKESLAGAQRTISEQAAEISEQQKELKAASERLEKLEGRKARRHGGPHKGRGGRKARASPELTEEERSAAADAAAMEQEAKQAENRVEEDVTAAVSAAEQQSDEVN